MSPKSTVIFGMEVKFDVVCYEWKKLSNGEYPLMLKITKDGQRRYQSINLSVSKKDWDFKRGKLKPNGPNYESYNKIIQDTLLEVRTRIIDLKASKKRCTLSKILETTKKDVTPHVTHFYESIFDQLTKEGKCGNRQVYQYSLNSLRNFRKNFDSLYFEDIDLEFLKKYEQWLKGRGIKETTISQLFRTLRSAYNKAIYEGIVKKDNYPFDMFRVGKFNVKTKKRAIDKSEMMKFAQMENAPVERDPKQELALDIFVFSYLSGGISFVDIANLKEENIEGDMLVYHRQKTGKEVRVSLVPASLKIIAKNKAKSYGYLFPIFNSRVHKTAEQKMYRVDKVRRQVNHSLAKLGEELGCDRKITTYVARHTFATVMKRAGVDVTMISEAMGHSSIETTQIYLDSFEDNQIKQAMTNLL